jgi:hypothetical protein
VGRGRRGGQRQREDSRENHLRPRGDGLEAGRGRGRYGRWRMTRGPRMSGRARVAGGRRVGSRGLGAPLARGRCRALVGSQLA